MIGFLFAGCGKKEDKVIMPNQADLNEVAVWVDQYGIPLRDIQQEANRLFMNAGDIPPERVPLVQLQMLQQSIDNMVIRQLLRAEMERSGVLVTQGDIEAAKKDLEKGLGEGRTLTMLIAEANLPISVLEDNLRLDVFKNKVLEERRTALLAGITDETAKAYYDEHMDEFVQPEGRLASHILIRVREDADATTRAKALARAEETRKALVEGADFVQLAREASDCASARNGGNLGLIPRGREAPAFEEAVYTQPIDQIGAVIESPVGYHIVKVTGEQDYKQYSFDEVKNWLLIQMRTRAQQALAAEYIAELRQQADIRLAGSLAALADQLAADSAASAEEAAPTGGDAQ